MTRLLLLPVLLGPLLGVAGCAATDPLSRPGLWHPIGANDANLRAMIADPEDLHHGAVDGRADGEVAANAVARYRAGKVKELPDSAIAKIAPISINNNSSGAAAGGN